MTLREFAGVWGSFDNFVHVQKNVYSEEKGEVVGYKVYYSGYMENIPEEILDFLLEKNSVYVVSDIHGESEQGFCIDIYVDVPDDAKMDYEFRYE